MPRIPKSLVQNNINCQIETPNGFESFYGVNKIERDWYVHLVLSNNKEIKSSPRHPFLSSTGDIILAHELKLGDQIQSRNGLVSVQYAEIVEEHIELYDIVDAGKDHVYYTNDVISHNCEFIGSVNTLISASKLKNMPFTDPIHTLGELDVYKEPVANHIYTIVVDVSHGEGLDFSAFSVFDCGKFPYEQVAKFRSSRVSPLAYPTIIQNVGHKYNNAHLFIEVNDIGQQVADILHYDLEYENILMVTTRGRAGQSLGTGFGAGTLQFGIKTSKKVKQIGCMNLKNLIEADKFIVQDFDTISELTSFVAKGYSYEAEPGHNDDLVMTLVLFSWLTTQPYFKDITAVDTRINMIENRLQQAKESEDQAYDDLVPFGFISAGDEIDENAVRVDRGGDSWLWNPGEKDTPTGSSDESW